MKRDSEKLSLSDSDLSSPMQFLEWPPLTLTLPDRKGTEKASKNPASLTPPLFMLVALKVSHFAASCRNAIWQKLDIQTSCKLP